MVTGGTSLWPSVAYSTSLWTLRYVQNCLNDFPFTLPNSFDTFHLISLCSYLLCGYNTGDRNYSNSFLISTNTLLQCILAFFRYGLESCSSSWETSHFGHLHLSFLYTKNFLKVNGPWSSSCPLEIISDNLRPNILCHQHGGLHQNSALWCFHQHGGILLIIFLIS